MADLKDIASRLVGGEKGILAADESSKTAAKRFEAVSLECTEENRRLFRQLLLTTPQIEHYITGVILHDETFWQKTDQGQPFTEYLTQHNVMPGIKVDGGLVDLPGFPEEQITQGLDGLPERVAKYAAAGAKFAKWRAVVKIGDGIPSDVSIGANAYVLARYARICQDAGIVPMVEPEVLFDGQHSAERCAQVIAYVYDVLFQTLKAFKVDLEGTILKTSMVLPGKESGEPIVASEVAARTAQALRQHVPEELGGVVFLSGGQTPDQAMQNLNAIEQQGNYPWGLTFSYSRALQDPVLKHWAQDQSDVPGAQQLFVHQLQLAKSARAGHLASAGSSSDSFVSGGQD